MEVEGVNETLAWLKRIRTNIKTNVQKAVIENALDLQQKSQDSAPIKEGHLRASAYTTINNLSATVGFKEPYAHRQHEHEEYNHPKGGQAKYLTTPLKQNNKKYTDNIKDAVIDAIKNTN